VKRRTLDFVFSVVGLGIAVLLFVLFAVLSNNASFARGYVRDQLAEQRIAFTPADKLSADEKSRSCLVKYAGQPLRSGAQAECYANDYIGLHVAGVNGGKTYSETSTESRAARAKADAAVKANDPAAAELDAAAKALAGKTDTLFRGETLRGLLLTSYGFSIFGERAQQAATVSLLASVLCLLAALAGLVHAWRTPRSRLVFTEPRSADTGLVGAGR
jgi:hypothetical protein